MVDYKSYQEACKVKCQWELDRKNIQRSRSLRRQMPGIYGEGEGSLLDKIKLSIVTLGFRQAKKYLELMEVKSKPELWWALDLITKEVDGIRAARNDYRKMLANLRTKS